MKNRRRKYLPLGFLLLAGTVFLQNCDVLISSRFAKIAFVSNRSGSDDIWIVHENGYNLVNLTETPGINEREPVISPDGTRIAFWQNNVPIELFVMNIDGSGAPINVSRNGDSPDANPNWSPDGSRIVFISTESLNNEIYICNSDATGIPINLTNTPSSEYFPRFSKDGTQITYTSNNNIYVMNADGTNKVQLTTSGNDIYSSWSPDGTKIAFGSRRDGDDEIFVMNADGSDQRQITFNTVDGNYPEWSPNGRRLAYYSGSGPDICVVNADGNGSPQNLTIISGLSGYNYRWSPDGREILFETYYNGNYEIFIMTSDGTNPRNLTNLPGSDETSPTWWFR